MTKEISRRLKRTIENLEGHNCLVAPGEYSEQLRRRLLDLMEIRRKVDWAPTPSLIGLYVVACVALLVSSIAPIAWFYMPEVNGDLLLAAVRVVVSSDGAETETNVIHARTLQIRLDGDETIELGGAQLAFTFPDGTTAISELVLTVPVDGPPMELDLPSIVGGSAITIATLGGGRWRFEVERGNGQTVLESGLVLPRVTTVEAVSVRGATLQRTTNEHSSSMTVTAARVLRLEVDGIDVRRKLFRDQIPASQVALLTATSGGYGELRSSVVGGEISLPSVKKRLSLKPGQLVTWELSEAVIWEILFGGVETLRLRIGARVRKIAVDRRSHNPSVMGFISESRWFDLIWTSVVAVTGFFFLLSRVRQS